MLIFKVSYNFRSTFKIRLVSLNLFNPFTSDVHALFHPLKYPHNEEDFSDFLTEIVSLEFKNPFSNLYFQYNQGF